MCSIWTPSSVTPRQRVRSKDTTIYTYYSVTNILLIICWSLNVFFCVLFIYINWHLLIHMHSYSKLKKNWFPLLSFPTTFPQNACYTTIINPVYFVIMYLFPPAIVVKIPPTPTHILQQQRVYSKCGCRSRGRLGGCGGWEEYAWCRVHVCPLPVHPAHLWGSQFG